MNSRAVTNAFFLVCLLAFTLVLARQIFTPDGGALLFERAQHFESTGRNSLALSHYKTLAQTEPQSVYAPRALLKIGNLLASQGRQSGNRQTLREAVAAYEKLATTYPEDALAGEALLDAGEICAQNLNDKAGARRFYGLLLKNSPPQSEDAARATLKLGLLALEEGEKETAQSLLQSVLQKWPKNVTLASEAQYRLGVLYETLFKNREWATRAYDAVIANYPASIFANNARGRLGLLAFSDAKNRRPTRRVLLQIEPFPRDGTGRGDGSLWESLPLLMAARGVDVDSNTLRAWSLEPFFCAVDTAQPGRVVTPAFDDFENAVANAGLRFTIKGGGKAETAMDDLQSDLDFARLPLVYYNVGGQNRWALCVGYDSARGELFLQEGGAQFQTVSAKSFAKSWEAKGPWGKSFTLLSFYQGSEKNKAKPNLTPAPTPSPAPGQTPAPVLEITPTFEWQLPPLSRKAGHRNTLRRAALLLERAPDARLAPNLAGLAFLERELRAASSAPRRALQPASPAATPTVRETPIAGATPTPAPEDPFADPFATPTPLPETPAETPAPVAVPRETGEISGENLRRARRAAEFFGDASTNWARKRREAAQFLQVAANQLGDRSLDEAASALEQSASALENAMVVASNNRGMRAETLRELVREVATAREAETRAAKIMR